MAKNTASKIKSAVERRTRASANLPVDNSETPIVVKAVAGVTDAIQTALQSCLNSILDGLGAVENSTREFAVKLNEFLPKEWYLIPNVADGKTPDAKQVRVYRTMVKEGYEARFGKSPKTSNNVRQRWSNICKYGHQADDKDWAEAEKAKEAEKVANKGNGANASTPKEPTPRIVADVFPVYKFLFKHEAPLSAKETRAMGFLRDAGLFFHLATDI